MTKRAVMVCGHGSRDTDAIREFEKVAEGIKARLPDCDVETGYLEFARPMIRDGLDALKQRGATEILAVPGMLFAATHVKNDLPWEINSFMAENPGITVKFGRDLGIEPKLLEAAAARIAQAEIAAGVSIPRSETLLLVVGRGTKDPDANSSIAKIARMLWEGMGFGWAETAFSGVAYPLVEEGLERSAKLGFKRIIVFPYFLFTGILVKRIYAETDAVAQRHPGIDFVKASYLNDHPLVLDTFAERVGEIAGVETNAAMNCSLCKYREKIVGYADEQGAIQAGHHHHVRGIGTDEDHGHGHSHGHGHDHGDGHHHHHHDV